MRRPSNPRKNVEVRYQPSKLEDQATFACAPCLPSTIYRTRLLAHCLPPVPGGCGRSKEKRSGNVAKRSCWPYTRLCPYSCYPRSCNRLFLYRSSCLCSHCLRSYIHLCLCNRFDLCRSVFPHRNRRDCERKCLPY